MPCIFKSGDPNNENWQISTPGIQCRHKICLDFSFDKYSFNMISLSYDEQSSLSLCFMRKCCFYMNKNKFPVLIPARAGEQ